MATYSSYKPSNASRRVRYLRHGAYCLLDIFDPPGTSPTTGEVFTGARPIFIAGLGGANQVKGNWTLGGNAFAQAVTDRYGGYVVVANGRQGGMHLESAEEVDMLFSPDLQAEAALVVMFLRANATNSAVVGGTFTLQTDPRYWCMYGESSWAWRALWSQMIPRGDFGDLADALSATGDGSFKYDHDHTVGHFVASSMQNSLSQFTESVAYAGEGTYLVKGAVSADATSFEIDGDGSTTLRAGNRIYIETPSTYLVNAEGGIGDETLEVYGDATAIAHGCGIGYTISGTRYVNWLSEAYAGDAGNVNFAGFGLDVVVPAGTQLRIVQELAVTTDKTAGDGTVYVWPPVIQAIADNAEVRLVHDTDLEGYGDQSWAIGYLGTKSDGRVWRSADSNGIPLGEKRHADVDYLVRSDNPRCKELNVLVYRSAANCLQRVDSLTHARSFWPRVNQTTPAALPERNHLHDEGDAASFAHKFYLAGSNSPNVHAYIGDYRSNPNGTDASVPWLKGRSGDLTTALFRSFITDANRAGGSFA